MMNVTNVTHHGVFILGFGHYTAYDEQIEVCKKLHHDDFSRVSSFIDKIQD